MTNERENEPEQPPQHGDSGGQQNQTDNSQVGRDSDWGERSRDRDPEREHK